jgi:hypothetical protein
MQLIAAGKSFVDRPSILSEYLNAHFMGKVLFRDGWVCLKDEEMNKISKGKAA